jgi:hypothetical protein
VNRYMSLESSPYLPVNVSCAEMRDRYDKIGNKNHDFFPFCFWTRHTNDSETCLQFEDGRVDCDRAVALEAVYDGIENPLSYCHLEWVIILSALRDRQCMHITSVNETIPSGPSDSSMLISQI